MAYNPADLRLPPWLLRSLDALIRIEVPLAPKWRLGMTRPGVLLAGVLIGLWLAAFYSGNNLLYLCGAMLSALVFASIWQGVRLLKSVPQLAEFIPSATEAGDSYALHMPMPSGSAGIGIVDVQWFGEKQAVPLQMRLEDSAQLTGRLRADMRALVHLDRQRLTTAAPLGVWKISRWRHESRTWAVLPRAVAWAENISGNSQLSRPYEGDELRDLRSYVPGDALSRIHWRKAASAASHWTVKRFEQHEPEIDTRKIRIDLRLPDSAETELFEAMLGRAWYWIDGHLRRGEERLEVILGQQQFDLISRRQREAFYLAMADASPESSAVAGEGGVLLSLVEGE